MNGHDSSAAAPNSSAVAERRRRGRRHSVEGEEEEDGGAAAAACTGKSCQACTAGAIADCVAVCCCPCALVNFFTLTFLKLPWAMARKCLVGGGKKDKKKKKKKKNKKDRPRRESTTPPPQLEGKDTDRDMDGICEKERAEEGTSEIALSSPVDKRNDNFGAEFKVEDVWLEVGHMGFGRVSFTGAPVVHSKGN